jgi:hypothetical protein
MQTLRFRSQVDAEGKLQLQLDSLPANQDLEIIVVYQPIQPDMKSPTTHQQDDPIVGLFTGSSHLSEESENILQKEIQSASGWTWKS